MTDELVLLATITLIFILAVFTIAGKQTAYDKEMEKRYPPPSKKKVQKSDEIIDTLDWMLANSIITPQEYTKLVGKCLPFLQ